MRSGVVVTAVARTLFVLATSIWLGGLAFFGIVTAPFLFRIARTEQVPELAPQMVTAMLGRFTFFTYVCTILLLLAWGSEWRSTRRGRVAKGLWLVQGGGTLLAGAIALYLGAMVFPTVVAGQQTILPIMKKEAAGKSLSADEIAERERFDKGHKAYNRLASLSVWLLLGAAIAFAGRTSLDTARRDEER